MENYRKVVTHYHRTSEGVREVEELIDLRKAGPAWFAACYCRTSGDPYEGEEPIESQKKRLARFAAGKGRVPVFFVDEGVSAANSERPELERLLEAVRGGRFNTALFTRLDRIVANADDLQDLIRLFEDCRAYLKALDDEFDTTMAVSRSTVALMFSLAGSEREMISQRLNEDEASYETERRQS